MVASGTSEDCKGSETKGLRVAPGHAELAAAALARHGARPAVDRKSTRLNSSHVSNSYAVFCLKKKAYFRKSHILALTVGLSRWSPTYPIRSSELGIFVVECVQHFLHLETACRSADAIDDSIFR